MGIYSILDRGFLLPIGERIFKRNLTGEYRYSQSIEWISKEDLYELQCKKLRQLIVHCYNNVPYYRRVFDNLSLTPDDIKSREDLYKLPILTKEIIKKEYNSLISKDYQERQYINSSTGGSTGTPMKFLTDMNTWNRLRAAGFRMWHSAGYDVGDKMFTLAGNSLVKKISEGRRLSAKDIYDIVIMRNNKRNCTDISETALADHYRSMCNYKPKAIRGYASSLYFLAKYIDQNNLPIPNGVRVVFTTGEKLHEKYRCKIQQVFRVPVFDGYGAGDGGIGAYECPMHEGLHISEENCILEITDKNGNVLPDGDIGFVLSTDLNNYVFPFLRYKVGDMAYIKKTMCSCGRGSRLLGEVIGREGKAIYNKQGRPYSSIVIDNMMFRNLDYHSRENQKLYEKMDRFQIRQDCNGDILILIKPVDKSESIHTFDYVMDNFSTYFPDSKVELRFVDDIPTLPSGKEDYCVSEYTPNIDK